jgi:hypothetical protein
VDAQSAIELHLHSTLIFAMARTFLPHYEGACEYLWTNLLKCADEKSKTFEEALCGAFRLNNPVQAVAGSEAWATYETELEELDAAYDMGLRKRWEMISVNASIATLVEKKVKEKTHFFGSKAVFALYWRLLDGVIIPKTTNTDDWARLDPIAKEVAFHGTIASFATHFSAKKHIDDLSLFAACKSKYPRLMDLMSVCDSFVYGIPDSRARNAIQAVLEGAREASANDVRCTQGHFATCFPDITVYFVAGMFMLVHRSACFFVDMACLRMLRDVLWTAGQWAIYAVNGGAYGLRDELGKATLAAFDTTIQYVASQLRIREEKGESPYTLARQMKTSYAIFLCKFVEGDADPDEATLIKLQEPALIAEVCAVTALKPYWFEVAANWPARVQIDTGTAFNMLPAPDIDIRELDASLHAHFERPRVYDDNAWAAMLRYSAGVISAHILFNHPDATVKWAEYKTGDNPEEYPWVISCRSGKFVQPDDEHYAVAERSIKWEDSLDNWQWEADDCTHVSACLEDFRSRDSMSRIPGIEFNEALYTLKYGDLFSRKYSPAAVRESWDNGHLVGDLFTLVAGKGETTKFGKKTRDTHSAVDTLRAVLSMFDRNCAHIASVFPGPIVRLGRRDLEKSIKRILTKKYQKDILGSMDVSGWSPEAPRVPYLRFMDMLLRFFDGCETRTISSVFSRFHVVLSKVGYHAMWESLDGSIQGFFGTADTILHCMMSTWAFTKVRASGMLDKHTRFAKAVLIDDIIAVFRNASVGGVDILNQMGIHYLSLGYKIDTVKTLFSLLKAHLLNRLYYDEREVVTCAKIFARADRDHDARFPSIWENIDAVFSGFVGAMDRGAPVVLCYAQAIWRATTLAIRNREIQAFSNPLFTAVGVFLPRSLAGWGIPSLAQLAVRECSDTTTSCVSTITMIRRQLRVSQVSLDLDHVMCTVREVKLDKRSPQAIFDDPLGVHADFCTDPLRARRASFRKAISKFAEATVVRDLMDKISTDSYTRMLSDFLHSGCYPAPVISQLGSALPHAVFRQLCGRLENTGAVVRIMTRKARHDLADSMRIDNHKAVVGWMSYTNLHAEEFMECKSGTDIVAHLRERQMAVDGISMSDYATSGAVDAIGHNEEMGNIDLWARNLSDRERVDGVRGFDMVRSTMTKPLVHHDTDTARPRDPISRAIEAASIACSYLSLSGLDSGPSENLILQAWIGPHANCSLKAVELAAQAKSPFRVASRLSQRTFTCMAFPNSFTTAHVSIHKAASSMSGVRMTVDWPHIVYALRFYALLDNEIHAPHADHLHFTLRAIDSLTVDTSAGAVGPFSTDFPGAMSGSARDVFLLKVQTVSDNVRMPDYTDDFIRQIGVEVSCPIRVGAPDMRRMPVGLVHRYLGAVPFTGLAIPHAVEVRDSDVDQAEASTAQQIGSLVSAMRIRPIAQRVASALLNARAKKDDGDPEYKVCMSKIKKIPTDSLQQVFQEWGKPEWLDMTLDDSKWDILLERVLAEISSGSHMLSTQAVKYYTSAAERHKRLEEENKDGRATEHHFIRFGCIALAQMKARRMSWQDQVITLAHCEDQACHAFVARQADENVLSNCIDYVKRGLAAAIPDHHALAAHMVEGIRVNLVQYNLDVQALLPGAKVGCTKVCEWMFKDVWSADTRRIIAKQNVMERMRIAKDMQAAISQVPVGEDDVDDAALMADFKCEDDVKEVVVDIDDELPAEFLSEEFKMFSRAHGMSVFDAADKLKVDETFRDDWVLYQAGTVPKVDTE